MRATRSIRYRDIADSLLARIAAGTYAAGRLLPSEADLAEDYAASRVTVRRALDILRQAGHVDSRQGLGWFVATAPVRQTLTRLGTIEGQMADSGLQPARRVLEFAYESATGVVAAQLGVDQVLRVKRVNLADGEPFAVVTVWCPAELAEHLSRSDVEQRPFYELIDRRLRGATQTIGADIVSAADADLLGVPLGSAIVHCRRVTTDVDGRPVLMSEHVFPAHRTEFVVELPNAEPSMAPSGLRIVE